MRRFFYLILCSILWITGCTDVKTESDLSKITNEAVASSNLSYNKISDNGLEEWFITFTPKSAEAGHSRWLLDMKLVYKGNSTIKDVSITTSFGTIEVPELISNSPIELKEILLQQGEKTLEIIINWTDGAGTKEGSQTYNLLWE
ncbi:hypothetical protein AB6A23_13450 [Paenibacillus tarimensis]